MIKKDRVSIIIPVFNLEKFIEKCIKSVLNQTYKNIEVIAVDDGSTDNSLSILYKLQNYDKRLIVIHKENGGVSSARIVGMKNASGNWIGFVDGDDTIDENMYEILVNNAVKFKADISHCGYKMIINNEIRYFHDTKEIIIQTKEKGLIDLLMGERVEPGLWNKLYNRKIIKKYIQCNLPNFDQSIKINEDLLMNYYLFNYSNKSVFVDECLYNYIIRDNSASRGELTYNKIFDPIKVRNIICGHCDNQLKDIASFVRLRTSIYVYLSIIIANEKKYDLYKSKIKKLIKDYYFNSKIMTKNIRILSLLIINFSYPFNLLYKIYYKYIQKKIYN